MIMNLNGAKDPNDLWLGGDWMSDILPKGGKMGRGGNAFNVSVADQSRSTMLKMVATVNGYAYSSSGITQKTQMVVLALYILLALCHICYSLYTGISSSSWGSGPEVAALAMNSEPATELKNTGAGIQTVEVFKHKVKVQARGDELQMMFQSNIDRSDSMLSQPKPVHPTIGTYYA
jgi:hypothetical protein